MQEQKKSEQEKNEDFANCIAELVINRNSISIKQILRLAKTMNLQNSLIVKNLFLTQINKIHNYVTLPDVDKRMFVEIYTLLSNHKHYVNNSTLNNVEFATALIRHSLTIPMLKNTFEHLLEMFGGYICIDNLIILHNEYNDALTSTSNKFIGYNKGPFNKFAKNTLYVLTCKLLKSMILFIDGESHIKIRLDELKVIIQNIEFEPFTNFIDFDMLDQMSKFLGILTAMYPEYSEHFKRRAQDFEFKLEVFERRQSYPLIAPLLDEAQIIELEKDLKEGDLVGPDEFEECVVSYKFLRRVLNAPVLYEEDNHYPFILKSIINNIDNMNLSLHELINLRRLVEDVTVIDSMILERFNGFNFLVWMTIYQRY